MKDLSNLITVFLITTDNDPNYQVCLDALKKQSCKFKLDIIKDYSPMSKAFQEMLNRVDTPFFIECDGDMILHWDAVETMYEAMTETEYVMKCFLLTDVHLNFNIYGVKVYKSEIFKKYPYDQNHPSCEMRQIEQLQKDGYKYECVSTVKGEHSPLWTNDTIFERYYNLMQKFRLYHYVWLEQLPKNLYNVFKKEPSEQNFYAIAGMLAGVYEDNTINAEKNVSKKLKQLWRVRSFFDSPSMATVYMTSDCNFLCSWCSRQHNEKPNAPDMTPELVTTLLKKFPTINGVCICGFGEPLLSNNLIPVIQTIKKINKSCGLITNGSLLLKRLPELIANKPSYISISLNAHNQEEHENTTKTKTWDTVIEGIKACNNSGIETYVSSVVTTENLSKLPEFIKFVHSLEIKTLHLHNILPHSNNEIFWKLALQEEHKPILNEIMKLPESSIVKKWPVLIDKNGGHSVCEFPFKSIAIDGNGSISICNSVLPCDAKNGNINDHVVFNSEYCTKFRDDFIMKSDKLPCNKCFRNWKCF
jgi:MoaA/NifB/PqqE/SkfB family radical SAM enzyme